MRLLLLFIAVPLLEIALFIQIGSLLTLWPTLAIVVLTAMIGTYLVRQQGGQALLRLRQSFETLSDPSEPLAHGAMILFSGALLLTPGFFTDTVGFLLLVPRVRRFLIREISKRINVQSFSMGSGPTRPRDDGVIEGDYTEADPPQDGPSGWTRH